MAAVIAGLLLTAARLGRPRSRPRTCQPLRRNRRDGGGRGRGSARHAGAGRPLAAGAALCSAPVSTPTDCWSAKFCRSRFPVAVSRASAETGARLSSFGRCRSPPSPCCYLSTAPREEAATAADASARWWPDWPALSTSGGLGLIFGGVGPLYFGTQRVPARLSDRSGPGRSHQPGFDGAQSRPVSRFTLLIAFARHVESRAWPFVAGGPDRACRPCRRRRYREHRDRSERGRGWLCRRCRVCAWPYSAAALEHAATKSRVCRRRCSPSVTPSPLLSR